MAWIKSSQELARHPKVKKLARILGINVPQAIGHLHLLWWWALDFAQDGDLSSYEPEDIAEAAGWEGDAAEFVKALVDAKGPSGHGFLDDDDGLRVHDWEEYAGALLVRRKKNAEYKRASRQRKVSNMSATCQRPRVDKSKSKSKSKSIGGEYNTTHVRSDGESNENLATSSSPPPTAENKRPLRGWEPTPDSTQKVGEVVSRLEALFGQYPFLPKMLCDGRADTCREELASVLRLLTVDEVVETVRREYERARRESKGTSLPRNLPYYMPVIKAAFAARDKELEAAERKRDEEKRRQARTSVEEPTPIAEIMLTEEDRKKIKERITAIREQIRTVASDG